MTTLVGALVAAAAVLIVGSGDWPMKLMRQLQFEHWWFVGMLVGLIVMPWTVTRGLCPDSLNAPGSVDASVLIRTNLFALGWGVAKVLCGLWFVRIGFALTRAIRAGLSVSLGASVGFGIQQSTQMLGNQGVGFINLGWRGVSGAPRHQMVAAIGLLNLAAIMASGNTLTAN